MTRNSIRDDPDDVAPAWRKISRPRQVLVENGDGAYDDFTLAPLR
jgi:hypothetical protein